MYQLRKEKKLTKTTTIIQGSVIIILPDTKLRADTTNLREARTLMICPIFKLDEIR